MQQQGPRIAVLDSQESLGIAIWKIPFYRAVKRAWPGARITLITAKKTVVATALREVMRPYVDQVLDQARIEKPVLTAARNLRAMPRYDIVFDARTKGLRVLWAKLFLRHGEFVSMLPGFLLTSRRRGKAARPRHWVGRLMAMLEVATGQPADWRGEVPLPAAAHAAAAHLLPEGPVYVGLCPGAAGAYKVWPLDRFIDLGRRVAARGWVPVLMIGPDEREMVPALREALPDARFPELDRSDPHPEIKGPTLALALGRRLAVGVANCTGIGHLLAVAGTPVVSLSGPTDPARFLPWVEPVRSIRAQDYGGTENMAAIPVDPVEAAVIELVAGSRKVRAPAPVRA